MDKLFIRVYYDLNNIKESSIWKIGVTDENNHVMYMETLHEHLSPNLSEDLFNKLSSKSYFKGLTGVDEFIGSLSLMDSLKNEKTSDINIFVDSDIKFIDKFESYLKSFFKEKEILLVFKDSFEEILFLNFVGEAFNNYNIRTININSMLAQSDAINAYDALCKKTLETDLHSLENEEMIKLFCYIQIVIESLLLKDFFTYINK